MANENLCLLLKSIKLFPLRVLRLLSGTNPGSSITDYPGCNGNVGIAARGV